jgi:hypothetical protein
MTLSDPLLDLAYFLLASPLGEVAAYLAGSLILASVVDGVVSAVQVIRS